MLSHPQQRPKVFDSAQSSRASLTFVDRDDDDNDSNSTSSHSHWSTSSCVSSTSASSTSSQTSSATTSFATVTTSPVVVRTGVSGGAVAGIVIGVGACTISIKCGLSADPNVPLFSTVAALAALLLLGLCLRRRNRRRNYLQESESNMSILAGAAVASVPAHGARQSESGNLKVLASSPPTRDAQREAVEERDVSRIHALVRAAATSDDTFVGSVAHLPVYTQLPRLQTENLSMSRGSSQVQPVDTDDTSLTRPLLRPASIFSLPNPHSPVDPPNTARFSVPLPARVERDLPSVPHSPSSSETHPTFSTSTVISSAITREMLAGGSDSTTSDANSSLRGELAVHQKHLEAVHRALRTTGDGVVSSTGPSFSANYTENEADPPPEYREADDADAEQSGASATCFA